ncbi:RNA polymerase sigma-70 factor [Massilibacteroides sp.]|uniref:RNA polymerase sigma-70 factor n=1 Tax=Massilibacteroides sp. TaxID=2034766 RepID=UPI002638A70B|nr:RNA polymerase sigma-70 factor [Massilibacteroides sp.]MDD4514522.1 RNA polymerase sigma-70 factor [Massilibacteroides sp.]
MKKIDIHNNEAIQQQLKTGDESVFDAVYTFYYGRLCAFAVQYVELDDAKEIVQEVMLWLWENREMLIPEMSLKSLLFTMVKNKSLNSLEHVQVKRKVHEKLYEKFRLQFEDPDFYVYGELMGLVDEAIKKLPEEYRKAFEMNRFDGLTYNEIAEIGGVSPKTIAYRITQALKILRIELKDYLPLLIWLLHK